LAAAPGVKAEHHAAADDGAAGRLTNEAIFEVKRYEPAKPEALQWLPDGGYAMLEAVEDQDEQDDDEDPPKEIVRYDAKTGERTVLVNLAQLTPPGTDTPLVVDDYHWSEDRTQLLIYTNSQKVWRQKTRGDYWVLSFESGKLRQLGGIAEPASLQFAKFSPDGRQVAYARDADVYVEDIASGDITRLTTRESDAQLNGITSWAYEEEFGIRDGFRWSPDGSHIAFWQFDTSGVRDFVLINNTDELYPKLTHIPYPKVGETVSAARIGVVTVDGGSTVWMELPGDPRQMYIPRMDFAGERSDAVLIHHVNRKQDTNTLYYGDAASGKTKPVFVERENEHLDDFADVTWLDGGRAFTWMSERSGWRHVLRVSSDGGRIQDLTPGQFDVVDLVKVDEEHNRLYFTASPDNATQRYLYLAPLDGKGAPKRITPADLEGTNSYDIAKDGAWAVHTHSRFDQPAQYHLVSLPDHERARTLVDNAELREKLAALTLGRHEFFRVTAQDGVPLDGFLMYPPDFDPTKRYPILFYVYGEPAGSTVVDQWKNQRSLWHLLMTQHGYLVASIDNRGARTPRGRDWRKAVYGQIGILSSRDQADALQAMLERFAFIDPERVGIWGHSGGGSMTLNMLFRYPDLYHVGVSRAPVPDQRLYDAIYQERYSGLLDDYAEAYTEASPITHAKHLKGRLLLVHGTGDDNVHYQGSERLINELVKHNRRFEFMSYPNRDHRINSGDGTSLHLHDMMTAYFEDHL
ncbi:MAG: DPP IV N-terminal domain-containing protein, partial [Pseudomonadota bacterium]